MEATLIAPDSFTNRQVAKLQGRAEGIAILVDGRILKDGSEVGRVEPGSKLHHDFQALFGNIDSLGHEYRQGEEAASIDDLTQIASFSIEVMLMPSAGGATAVGVQQERAFFSETDVARDVARLYEDYPLLARDLLARRGIELESPEERPELSSLGALTDAQPETELSRDIERAL